jgi:hypothetical protein
MEGTVEALVGGGGSHFPCHVAPPHLHAASTRSNSIRHKDMMPVTHQATTPPAGRDAGEGLLR